jgi:hypothetical protein
MSIHRSPFIWVLLLLAVVSMLLLIRLVPRSPTAKHALYGSYILDSDLIHEDLTIHSDGTFEQKITINATGEVLTSSGKWVYDTSDTNLLRHAVLALDGRIRVLERQNKLYPDYANRKPGLSYEEVYYWLGSLYISGNADSWPGYKKLD